MSRQWVTTRLLQTTSWKVNHIKWLNHVHTFSIICLWYCKFGIELYWCCNICSFIKKCHTLFYSKAFQNIYPPFLIFQLSFATLHAKKNTKIPSGLWYIHRTSQFMVVSEKKHQTRKIFHLKKKPAIFIKPSIFIWCFKHSLSFFALRIPFFNGLGYPFCLSQVHTEVTTSADGQVLPTGGAACNFWRQHRCDGKW